MKNKYLKSGFTMVEATIAIILVGLIAIFTLVKIFRMNNQKQFDEKYDKIAMMLESNLKQFMVMNTGWTFQDFTTNNANHLKYIQAVKTNLAFKSDNCGLACWSNTRTLARGGNIPDDVIDGNWNISSLADDSVLAIDGGVRGGRYSTTIYIDVNGRQGPNVLDRDIKLFQFVAGVANRNYNRLSCPVDSNCAALDNWKYWDAGTCNCLCNNAKLAADCTGRDTPAGDCQCNRCQYKSDADCIAQFGAYHVIDASPNCGCHCDPNLAATCANQGFRARVDGGCGCEVIPELPPPPSPASPIVRLADEYKENVNKCQSDLHVYSGSFSTDCVRGYARVIKIKDTRTNKTYEAYCIVDKTTKKGSPSAFACYDGGYVCAAAKSGSIMECHINASQVPDIQYDNKGNVTGYVCNNWGADYQKGNCQELYNNKECKTANCSYDVQTKTWGSGDYTTDVGAYFRYYFYCEWMWENNVNEEFCDNFK